jgi:hypothetical protein
MRAMLARRIVRLPAALCLAAGIAGCAPKRMQQQEGIQPQGAITATTEQNPLLKIHGKEILKSELDCLQRLAKDNGMTLPQIFLDTERDRIKISGGHVVFLDLLAKPVRDISALRGLRYLREVKLFGTKVSDADAAALKKANPGLSIIY